jgi:hypothetical protein
VSSVETPSGTVFGDGDFKDIIRDKGGHKEGT